MNLDGKWVQVSTNGFDDAQLLEQLHISTTAMQQLGEGIKIVTEISTVGNKQTIIRHVGTEICHTSVIDLTTGTPDKICSIFGKEWTIDLHLDESGTEVVGGALEPVEMGYRLRIVDHNLVEEYTAFGKTVTITSVPAEQLAFDNKWIMSHITGGTAFHANFPPITAEQQKVFDKLANVEISYTTVIKTTGDTRYVRRKAGDSPAMEMTLHLGVGTMDKIYGPFGSLYEMDLHWDEKHRKMVGEGTVNGQTMKITHEIINGKLVERYQNDDAEMVITHISADSIAFDGTWHRTDATGLEEYAELLSYKNPSAAAEMEAWIDGKGCVCKIKTVGDKRTITDSVPGKTDTVTSIDLTKGTPDTLTNALGMEQTVDLYWDEVNKKVCGTAKGEGGSVRVTHEILDGKLVRSFTSEKNTLLEKSVIALKITSEPKGYRKAAEFDGDWSMIHLDGIEALRIAYPQLFASAARKAFMKKFREAEGDFVTRIKTTGENKMSRTRIFMTEKGTEIGRFPTSDLDLTLGSPDPALGFLFGPGNTLDLAWNDNRFDDGHQMICGTGMIKGIECHVEMEIVDHGIIGEMLLETATLGETTLTRISVRSENGQRALKFKQVQEALKTDGIKGLRRIVFAPLTQ